MPERLFRLGGLDAVGVQRFVDVDGHPAVDVLVTILGRTRASRLTRTLRDELGLVSSVGSTYSAYEVAGMTAVTAQMDRGNLDRVEAEILRQLGRIRDEAGYSVPSGVADELSGLLERLR